MLRHESMSFLWKPLTFIVIMPARGYSVPSQGQFAVIDSSNLANDAIVTNFSSTEPSVNNLTMGLTSFVRFSKVARLVVWRRMFT